MSSLNELAKRVRLKVLDMSMTEKGCIGGSLSCVEILIALYSNWNGERIILSKGHAAPTLYAVLSEFGILEEEELKTFAQVGSHLESHPNITIPGVEVNTGSLGNGLGIGIGMALAGNKVIVVMGDGECHEGSVWEAAMLASHLKVNLTAIIDANGFCASGRISDINSLEPLRDKWEAFGWNVSEINGHDIEELKELLKYPFVRSQCIIARTIKGKGISFMENNASWHKRTPTREEYELAKEELNGLT